MTDTEIAAVPHQAKTRWFKRHEHPVRNGLYECAVRISNMQSVLFLWNLEWDGKGFLVPCPMVVVQWRGLKRENKL
jgi:hypothetical protein